MPVSCGVVGCSNNKRRDKTLRFYKLPAVVRGSDVKTLELSIRRRQQWLANINRRDLTAMQLHETKSTLMVCCKHFISGEL